MISEDDSNLFDNAYILRLKEDNSNGLSPLFT
jgi:hypothetical protein